MNIGVLAAVAWAAIEDPGLKRRLVESPDGVADSLRLDRDSVREVASAGKEGIEVVIGSMIIHRLIPFPVGERLLIVPQGFKGPVDTQRTIIHLDQSREGAWIGAAGLSMIEGRAFGSGGHPTTALCLRALETSIRGGDRVLDLGTGSGVIAIAAALLGAEVVDACDIDPFAVETARQNVLGNALGPKVSVTQDDLQSLAARLGGKTYDLLVSNILVTVHETNLQAGLTDLLRPGGTLILSGFHEDFVPQLRDQVQAHDVDVTSVLRAERWAAIVGRRR